MKRFIGTTKALEIAAESGVDVSRQTVITWTEKYNLGYKLGGRHLIFQKRFRLFIEGKKWKSEEKEKK